MKLALPSLRSARLKPVAARKPSPKCYVVELPDALHQVMTNFLWLTLEERMLFPNRPFPQTPLPDEDDDLSLYVADYERAHYCFHRGAGISLERLLTYSAMLSAGAGNLVGTKAELDTLCEWADHLISYLALAPHLFDLTTESGTLIPYLVIDTLLGDFIIAVDELEQSIVPLTDLNLTHKIIYK